MFDSDNIMSTVRTVAMRPPAKLNLSLVVFDKRADGFHELHTVMATVNLYDELQLRMSGKPGIQLHCAGLGCPETSDNLVCRAAELLAEHAQIKPAIEIYLNKRIPSGAGLGGASSDGAACLAGLNRLWELNLPGDELDKLAAQLGSDVPFFLHGPVAVCTGRGEIVKELPHHCSRSILLIAPDIHTSTGKIYQHYTYNNARVQEDMQQVSYFLRRGDLDGLITKGINSLTDVTMGLVKPLEKLRCEIENIGISPVHMTGSGSCLFATSDSDDQITQWAQQIQKHNLAQTFQVKCNKQPNLFPEDHHADI